MSIKLRFAVCCLFVLISFCFVLGRVAIGSHGQTPTAPQPTATPTPQSDGFGNVQVLKGVRDLLPTMHFIRASLGVRCDYCHITETGKYYLDDKPAKRRAREMIVMTRQLNQVAFNGRQVITCNTCHRGSPTPISIPQITTNFVNTTRVEPFEPKPPALPSAANILAQYEEATHAGSIGSARLGIEIHRAQLINGGTGQARVLPRAEVMKTDVLADGERGVTTTRLSNGQTAPIGSTGTRVWILGANGVQWITTGDLAQLKRKINPLLVLRVRQSDFSSMDVSGEETISGVDAYIVTAIATDGSTEMLWFSKRDHLLIRRTYFHSTLLGLEPEQYDLSEYKRVGAIRLPMAINASYLDDQHLGVLKRLTAIKLGVAVTENDFEPPTR